MIDVRKILTSIGWGVGATTILFVVCVSIVKFVAVMIGWLGSGPFALLAAWFVIMSVCLSIAFYFGTK